MRLAVISDTHFGDEHCTLVTPGQDGKSPRIGPAYSAMKETVGKVDYLVLLGDIIDFSVASYQRAYKHARVFFRQVQQDEIAREYIYVPGNHDFDIWHTVEHQVNVINQLKQGQLPRAFRRSVPGVIDDRPGASESKFLLPDVPPRPEWHEDQAYYGNLFLDHITRTKRSEGEKLTFNFAYPNVYLITDEGDCTLLTHGHYFESYWSFAAEWAMQLAGDDLKLESDGEMNLREMVGINLPLNQLACTGIGQAQPLTPLLRQLQKEVAAGRTKALRKYIGRLEATLKKSMKLSWLARWVRSYMFRLLKGRVLSHVAGIEQARYSKQFLQRPSVRERFRGYYQTSLHELERLQREHDLDIPEPTHVIFGHTHQPISWDSDELMTRVNGKVIQLCNTGGWLLREEKGQVDFVGAEIVIYESGKGVKSKSIGIADLDPECALGGTYRDM